MLTQIDFEGSQGADTGKNTMLSCSYSVVELQNVATVFVSSHIEIAICVSEHTHCDVCESTYRDCHVCETTHKDCQLNCQSLHLHGSMALMYLGSPSRVIATQHCLAAVFTL